MTNTIKILFLGDLVGRPARKLVSEFLGGQVACSDDIKYDFVIANVENASHGFGLTSKNYTQLSEAGVDCMTSGNHIWDKGDIFNYIDTAEKLVRPINYPEGTPGVGSRIFACGDVKIGVINVLGTTFMGLIDSYWKTVEEEIKKIKEITPIVFIDIHAEATAEKICFARWASNLGVSVVVGTHTHVQTADAQILNEKTAYITDAGFCGVKDSVIGMDADTSLKRFLTALPQRYLIAEGKVVQLNGVIAEVCVDSGDAVSMKSFMIEKIYDEENE